MKKLISLLLTAAMLASFALTGCGSGSTETTTAEGGQTTEETTQEETSSERGDTLWEVWGLTVSGCK